MAFAEKAIAMAPAPIRPVVEFVAKPFIRSEGSRNQRAASTQTPLRSMDFSRTPTNWSWVDHPFFSGNH